MDSSFTRDFPSPSAKKLKLGDDEINVECLLSCIHDLNHLERRNGEVVEFDETLRGKYVLVFCFEMPPLCKDQDLYFPYDLIKTCLELYHLRDDFELVVVVKRSHSPVAFRNFLYEFPPQCLAVPFDSKYRKLLCDFLHLDRPGFKCLLVNVEKDIMLHGDLAIEHLQSLLPEQPCKISRLIKAMWPVIPELVKHPSLCEDCCPIAAQYKFVKPEYSDDINMVVYESKKTRPIQIGHSFDVVSLLSSGKGELNYLYRNGGNQSVQVKEETFKGKYVMVCCYHVPIFREESISLFVQGLVTTCFDLYSTRQDFELVVVAKMNKMVNYEAVFNHFLSGFPASCLVVPFNDSKRRDFICKYLDLYRDCNCLILDDNGSVLLHEHPSFVRSYGADGFPFTQEHQHKLRLKDLALFKSLSTSNLEVLLQCKPSDVVDRINSAGVREVKTISELSTKLVGLYLCARGNFIPTLDEVYQQCITKHLEIEIVVVYMPFGDCLDPQAYKLNIDTKLKRKKIYWWRLPFDNSVSLGLKRLANPSMDKLIIMGPRGEFVDLYGEEVMSYYGIDGYPFTREGLVQRELKKLKEVTLESLLVHGSRDFVLQGDDRIPVAQLQGRNILIYLDCLYDHKHYENLLSWYHKMKELGTDFEVVFVRRVDDDDDDDAISGMEVEVDDLVVSGMPWLVCPFEFDHSASINKKLFTEYESHDTLVQFGQNGQISAFPTLEHLPSFTFGTNAFPFAGFHLRDFVTCQFREDFMQGFN